MRDIIGIGLIIVGIIFGIYAGIWWAFIGGIVDIIEQVRAEDLSAIAVAIGVVKILFAGVIGWGCAFILIIPGRYMIKDTDTYIRRL